MRCVDRVMLCLLAFAPLLYLTEVVRGDTPPPACPNQIAVFQPCPKGNPTAKCDTYSVADCTGKTYTEVYGGFFSCGSDPDKSHYCQGIYEKGTTPPVAVTGPCSRTYTCTIYGMDNLRYCDKGVQVGNTTASPVYEHGPCP